jgi:hypothetical protein
MANDQLASPTWLQPPLLSGVLQVLVAHRFIGAPIFHDNQDQQTKDLQIEIGKIPDYCAFQTLLTLARIKRVFFA